MRKKEQKVWDTMTRQSKGRRARPWLQRIENVVAEGMPDVVCVCNGLTTWVELKAPPAKTRPTSLLLGGDGLRQAQINWHAKAVSKGAAVYTLARDGHGELFLIDAIWSDSLNEQTIEGARFIRAAATWDEIFHLLENGK